MAEDAAVEASIVERAASDHIAADHLAATARLKLDRAKAERELAMLSQPLAADEVAAQAVALARLKLELARIDLDIGSLGQPISANDTVAQGVALARLNIELTTVQRDLVKLSRPWWRSWNITAIGAFLAAIAPATAAVSGHFEKEKQLALDAQKQDEDIRGRYLERMVDPHQTRRVLRLLVATSDQKTSSWAKSELPYVDEQAKAFDEERLRLQTREDSHEALLRDALAAMPPSDRGKVLSDLVARGRAAEAMVPKVLLNEAQSACDQVRSLLAGRTDDASLAEAARLGGLKAPRGKSLKQHYGDTCEK